MIELETSVQVQSFWQSPGCAAPATLEGGANKENSAGWRDYFFFFKEVFVKGITQNCQSSCMYFSE